MLEWSGVLVNGWGLGVYRVLVADVGRKGTKAACGRGILGGVVQK